MDNGFVDRLAQEIRSVDGRHSLGAGALAEALAPFIDREAASALRSSGEAVAWGFPNSAPALGGHALMMVRVDVPSEDQYRGLGWVPLYLHPATVTDEDVDRARAAYANGALFHSERIRTALESFVRPTPPASTKGG
jgi:hypothetical protein